MEIVSQTFSKISMTKSVARLFLHFNAQNIYGTYNLLLALSWYAECGQLCSTLPHPWWPHIVACPYHACCSACNIGVPLPHAVQQHSKPRCFSTPRNVGLLAMKILLLDVPCVHSHAQNLRRVEAHRGKWTPPAQLNDLPASGMHATVGMPCTQCTRSAKFCMSATPSFGPFSQV